MGRQVKLKKKKQEKKNNILAPYSVKRRVEFACNRQYLRETYSASPQCSHMSFDDAAVPSERCGKVKCTTRFYG